MKATELMPTLIAAFRSEADPFKGRPNTPENRAAAARLIQHYAGRAQLIDLSLSQADARQLLARSLNK